MRPQPRPASVEDLLEHSDWVRRLALGLVGNEAAADDLTQDTMLRAIERPPAEGSSIKAWLARVVRNLAIDHSRRRTRRTARELKVGERSDGPMDVPQPGDVQVRLELQGMLTEAVRELPEPYRTTTVMYYFDQLGTEEIASRMGLQSSTVRNQLSRARTRLRERLQRRYGGDWRALCIGLLLRPGKPIPPPPPPGIPAGAAGAVAAGVLLAGAWMVASSMKSDRIDAAGYGEESRATASVAEVDQQEPTRVAEVSDAPTVVSLREGLRISGPKGEAVVGATVRAYAYRWPEMKRGFQGPERNIFSAFPLLEEAVSDEAGFVDLSCFEPEVGFREPKIAVVIEAAGYVKRASLLEPPAGSDALTHRISLREGGYASLRVVDESGRAIEGASVLPIAQDKRNRDGHFKRFSQLTDERGFATFTSLALNVQDVAVIAPGYMRATTKIEVASELQEQAIVVTLARGGEASVSVYGWDGLPFEGAEVYLSQTNEEKRSARRPWFSTFAGETQSDGFLMLGGIDWSRRCSLIVRVDGIEIKSDELPEGGHTDVYLPPLAELSGRVIDHAGKPAARALVGSYLLEGEDKRSVSTAWTDDSGYFSFHVQAGLQGLGVWHSSGSLLPQEPRHVAPTAQDMGTLQLPKGRPLYVEVVNDQGYAVNDVNLIMRKPESVASQVQAVEPSEWRDFLSTGGKVIMPFRLPDGRFMLSHLPDGPHAYSVVSKEHQPVMITLDPLTSPDVTRVMLLDSVRVEFEVVHENGEPLSNEALVMYPSDFDWDWAEQKPPVRQRFGVLDARTDASGRVEFGRVAPGEWRLAKQSEGRMGFTLGTFTVPEEGLSKRVVIADPAQFRIVSDSGDSIPVGARLFVHTASDQGGRPGMSQDLALDANPISQSIEIPLGPQTVDVVLPGSVPRTVTFEADEGGQMGDQSVDLSGVDVIGRFPGTKSTGRVLLFADNPSALPSRDVMIDTLRDAVHLEIGGYFPEENGVRGLPFALTAVRQDERFAFRNVPPGRYRIYGTGSRLRLSGPMIVEVTADGVEVLVGNRELRLTPGLDAPFEIHVNGLVELLAFSPRVRLMVTVIRTDNERDTSYRAARTFQLQPNRNAAELLIEKERAGLYDLEFRLLGGGGQEYRRWTRKVVTSKGTTEKVIEDLH